MIKKLAKELPFYRELRYFWRATFHFGRPFSYAFQRYIVGPRIRSVKRTLDREPETEEYSLHVLCSHRDLTMAIWSLASWYTALPRGEAGALFIHEDGSFTEDDSALVARLFPHSTVMRADTARYLVATEWLKNYPTSCALRLRDDAVFMIKLVDPRFVSNAPARLLVDSDVLWFCSPAEVTKMLRSRERPFFMKGREPMRFILGDGRDIGEVAPTGLNAGITGYGVERYGLGALEEFSTMVGDKSNLYFVEQAGHAYVLSREGEIATLNDKEYHIKGLVHGATVAKHYTGPRREMFWFEGVRKLKASIL